MRRCEGVKRSNLQENNGSTSTDECVSEIQQASTRQRVHGRDSGLWGAVLTGAGPLTVEPVLLPVVTIICHVKKAYCGLAQPPSGTQEKAGEINVSNIKGGRQCETTPWSASLSLIASFFCCLCSHIKRRCWYFPHSRKRCIRWETPGQPAWIKIVSQQILAG